MQARFLLSRSERYADAQSVLRKATALDPLNPRLWGGLGSAYLDAGDNERARGAFLRSLEISPHQSFTPCLLGLTWLLEHDPERFLEWCRKATNPVFRISGDAIGLYSMGDHAGSQRALDELIAEDSHNAAYQIAQVYAWRGENDRAFEWLGRAREQHDGGLTIIRVDPILGKLHSDPRWRAFLASINLVP
jgi:tetratricopeptide (TPR) repeat protein